MDADEGDGLDSAAGMIATAMANLEARRTAFLGPGQYGVAQGGVQVREHRQIQQAQQ